MDTPPALLVCGLGRCGTTLMMNMLAVAGIPCVGTAPIYEETDIWSPCGGRLAADWRGHAVKMLDPHHSPDLGEQPVGLFNAIWMDRDFGEQAKSQLKFTKLMAGVPVTDGRNERRAMAKRLQADREKALATLRIDPRQKPAVYRCGGGFMTTTFEYVVDHPLESASQIINRLARWKYLTEFDASLRERMAGVVLKRSPKCVRDLSVELELARRAECAS